MLPRAAQTRVSLALCWHQEQYCVALLEKEYEVGCRWQSQAAASVSVCRHRSEAGLPCAAGDSSAPSAWFE